VEVVVGMLPLLPLVVAVVVVKSYLNLCLLPLGPRIPLPLALEVGLGQMGVILLSALLPLLMAESLEPPRLVGLVVVVRAGFLPPAKGDPF
jgi:hypothetical protein